MTLSLFRSSSMPISTMNGDHQAAASAPLDLSTCRLGTSAGSPPGSGCEDVGVTGRSSSGDHVHGRRKHPNSLVLPLRKRPVRVDVQNQDQFSPAEAPDLPRHGARIPARLEREPGGDDRLDGEPVTSYPGPHYANVYHVGFVAYGHPLYRPPPESNPPFVCYADPLMTSIAVATRQDDDGDTALHIAVVQGKHAMVTRLIHLFKLAQRDLNIYNNLRQTPLHLAVITQQPDMVDVLLRAGADPAAMDRNGQTSLHLCCEYDQLDCLSVLLTGPEMSLCLEKKNYEGLTPLHLAVLHGRKDVARNLLKVGADINAMDVKSGQNPLMHAVQCDNVDMIHFLIENGCHVNGQSYSGNTALHSASGRGQVETVRFLLKSGAESSLKNYHNDTAVMVAKNQTTLDVLRGRGTKLSRFQEAHCQSVIPHQSRLANTGAPPPKQSRGHSPSKRHTNTDSPKHPFISL